MEDTKITALLNALVSKVTLLDCQLLALRRLLDTHQILSDDEVEKMIAKTVQTIEDHLSKKTRDERLAEFLRKHEGTVQ